MEERKSCLIVASAHEKGVHLGSFMQAFTLTSSTFNVTIATPGGVALKFQDGDDRTEKTMRWLSDFKARPLSRPISLEEVNASLYTAILLTHGRGALFDLHNSHGLNKILVHFVEAKKPICAIGYGVTGLCSAFSDDNKKKWCFRKYCMTGPSLHELSLLLEFGEIPVITPDFIRQHGGNFNPGRLESVHVVVDQHVITGQNGQSTLTAIQNLILLTNAWQSKN